MKLLRSTRAISLVAALCKQAALLCLALATLALAGCHPVGPNYTTPPAVGLAPEFKEPGPTTFQQTSGWKAAQPSDTTLRGKWWESFADPQLNALEEQIDPANQTLIAADANFRAARAAIGLYRANLAPTLSVGPGAGAVRDSQNQPYAGSTITTGGQGEGNFLLPLDLSYEVDLWGRIRRSITAARETAQTSAADLETARLSLHAELALDYFGLRADDAQKKLLDDTVTAYRQALQLTQDRYNGGASPLSDVTQAATQLQTALVQDSDVTIERAQYEHAIAVLTGQGPAALTLPADPVNANPPAIPVIPGALPSQLLERRPDIAGDERRMAAANEQIGIAQAAFYPALDLSAAIGLNGTSLLNLFTLPSRFFAVGPTLNETVYDHGRRRAGSDIALAQYDATVANYRQTTLTAFQQVEDNLAALRVLETEASQQRASTEAAQQSLDLFNTRYEGGVDTYLQVVTSQTTALANQRNDIEIQRRRLEASVLLIKALGGGWSTAQLPNL
ncbi:MAG: efflux transporter outer membrane subunit [Acidobacteriaceae bacterium]|jgi:NodT family efflux transporter outer membrane factor (OMF) lipoprotein